MKNINTYLNLKRDVVYFNRTSSTYYNTDNRYIKSHKYKINALTVISNDSPRTSKGKLMLRSQPYDFFRQNETFLPSRKLYNYRLEYDYGYFREQTFYSPYREVGRVPALPDSTARATGPGSKAYDKASLGFYKQIVDTRANLAVAYAERQSTVNSITDLINRLAKAAVALKRGRFKDVRKYLALGTNIKRPKKQSFASQWLELQYGWLPLIGDIHGLLSLSEPPKKSVKSTGTDASSLVIGNALNKENQYSTKWKYRVTVKAMITLQGVPGSHLASQLGLTNPALVAWELVPFSFVVDWFYPIGSWLEAHSPTLGISYSDVNVTETVHLNEKSMYVHVPEDKAKSSNWVGGNSSQTTSYFSGSYNNRMKWKRRVINDLPDYPSIHFKNPISTGHAQNALALLIAVFKAK